jgi:hypothetical protein
MYEVGNIADTKCLSNFLTVSCLFFVSASSCHILVDTIHWLHHFLLSMLSSFSCFLYLLLLFLYLCFSYFRVSVLYCLNMLSIESASPHCPIQTSSQCLHHYEYIISSYFHQWSWCSTCLVPFPSIPSCMYVSL